MNEEAGVSTWREEVVEELVLEVLFLLFLLQGQVLFIVDKGQKRFRTEKMPCLVRDRL